MKRSKELAKITAALEAARGSLHDQEWAAYRLELDEGEHAILAGSLERAALEISAAIGHTKGLAVWERAKERGESITLTISEVSA